MRKYLPPCILFAVFEATAIALWLTKDNIFYLFNFTYIGTALSLSLILFIKKHTHAR